MMSLGSRRKRQRLRNRMDRGVRRVMRQRQWGIMGPHLLEGEVEGIGIRLIVMTAIEGGILGGNGDGHHCKALGS